MISRLFIINYFIRSQFIVIAIRILLLIIRLTILIISIKKKSLEIIIKKKDRIKFSIKYNLKDI